MKLISKIALILLIIAFIIPNSDSRRIRSKTSQATEYLKAVAQGFLSGIADESGETINSCLPESMKGKYLAQDVEEKEEEKKEQTSILETIWSKIKWALDLACKAKSYIMKFFGWGRRRYRRHHRRVFLTKSQKRIIEWFKKAWDWAKNTVKSFADWVSTQWDNLKEWTKDKWQQLKTWTANMWAALKEKIMAAVEKAKAIKAKVISWVINKALPVLSIVFKCGRIVLTIISKIAGIISAIVQIASGNALKLLDVIINLICSYETIIKVKINY